MLGVRASERDVKQDNSVFDWQGYLRTVERQSRLRSKLTLAATKAVLSQVTGMCARQSGCDPCAFSLAEQKKQGAAQLPTR